MKLTGFGYKQAWFVIQSEFADALLAYFQCESPTRIDWIQGMAKAYEPNGDLAFRTPNLDNWTMLAGTSLFTFGETPGLGERLLESALAVGAEVQYFASHRVVEFHAWARALPDGTVRAYAYNGSRGETIEDRGIPSAEELALGYRFFDVRSPEASSDGYWERADLRFPNEDDVMRLAGQWSLNPVELDGREVSFADGTLHRVNTQASPALATPTPPAKRPWWRLW